MKIGTKLKNLTQMKNGKNIYITKKLLLKQK